MVLIAPISQSSCHPLMLSSHLTVRKVQTVQNSTVQYSTVQYSSVQYSTVQYSTVQYSTVQYSTVQYSTVHHKIIMRRRFVHELREHRARINTILKKNSFVIYCIFLTKLQFSFFSCPLWHLLYNYHFYFQYTCFQEC